MSTGRRRVTVTTVLLAGSLAGIAGACGEAPGEGGAGAPAEAEQTPGEGAGGAGEDAAAAGSAAAGDTGSLRGVLPGLFGIMVGLQDDMARLDRGIWIENHDSIAAAARAVADHPTVPPEEFQRISGVLGDEMPSFGAMDRNVHDLAVEVEEHARAGRLEGVLRTGAELRQGCVGCHSAYRERLREGLGDPGPQ